MGICEVRQRVQFVSVVIQESFFDKEMFDLSKD